MPGQSANWNLPYRAPLDSPDLAAATFALANAADTALQTLKASVPLLVHGTGTIVGTYTGQALKVFTDSRVFTVDSNGDTVILALGAFNGLFSCIVSGASTFPITAAVRLNSGNLVARIWNNTTLVTSASATLSYIALGW